MMSPDQVKQPEDVEEYFESNDLRADSESLTELIIESQLKIDTLSKKRITMNIANQIIGLKLIIDVAYTVYLIIQSGNSFGYDTVTNTIKTYR